MYSKNLLCSILYLSIVLYDCIVVFWIYYINWVLCRLSRGMINPRFTPITGMLRVIVVFVSGWNHKLDIFEGQEKNSWKFSDYVGKLNLFKIIFAFLKAIILAESFAVFSFEIFFRVKQRFGSTVFFGISRELFPILRFVMDRVHLFLNGTLLARSSKLTRHKNSKLGGKCRRRIWCIWLLWTKTMIWCWKNAASIREGIGTSNEFLKIATREEPLIGFGNNKAL